MSSFHQTLCIKVHPPLNPQHPLVPTTSMALSSSYSSPFLLLLLLFATAAIASSDDGGEKTTHLHYYLHANYGGPNTTTITVVSPPGNDSGSSFGSIAVGDHMLKEGLDPSSTLIGKAEELAVQASLGSPAYLSAFNFVFTAGDYNGSSISILGRAAPSDAAIERGVVGGSGMFRMARGYTISRVVKSTGPDDFLFVMEFDAYVFLY